MGSALPENVPVDRTIYVGLALRSRDAARRVVAALSNVTTTSNSGAQWQHRNVGILNNAAETSGRNTGKKSCGLRKFRYSWSINTGRSRGMPAAVIVILLWEEKFQGDGYGN